VGEIAPTRQDVVAAIHRVYAKGEEVHEIGERMSETAGKLAALIDAAVETANELHGLAGQHSTASNQAEWAAWDALGGRG
jgi:hypothetical protein